MNSGFRPEFPPLQRILPGNAAIVFLIAATSRAGCFSTFHSGSIPTAISSFLWLLLVLRIVKFAVERGVVFQLPVCNSFDVKSLFFWNDLSPLTYGTVSYPKATAVLEIPP